MEDIKFKIRKNSKIMVTITRILCILLIIGLCIPISVLMSHVLAPNTHLLSLKGIHFYSSTGELMTTTNEIIAEMSSIILSSVFILFVLLLAYQIFKSISLDAIPFSQANAIRLKKIAIVLVIYSIVQPISRAWFYTIFAPEITIQVSLNVISTILSLIFFFISIVFTYGAELQRLSDETL